LKVAHAIGRNDLMWAYIAQFLRIGLGLLMLPVVMHYMTSEEVGLWFIFITVAGLAQLLELGFQPTLARNVAYIYSGAQELSAFGLGGQDSGELNRELLADLVCAAQWIYRRITLLVAIALWGGGSLYIFSVLPKTVDEFEVISGWVAFSAGMIINFYYAYLNALLQGRGDITLGNKVIVLAQLVSISMGAFLVFLGFGLQGLGLASLLSAILGRVMVYYYVYSSRDEMKDLVSSNHRKKEFISILWYNSWRFGLVMLGVFLIWRANILIAASCLGVVEAGSYALAIQLFFLVHSIATVPFQTALPGLNALRSQNEMGLLYSRFTPLLFAAILILCLGSGVILFFGNDVLEMIGSNTFLPNGFVLLIMSIVFILEINHGTCANFITTGNTIPFVSAALYTGLAIVILSYVLTPIYGVMGLILSQAVMQLLYNNWKWPHEIAVLFSSPYYRVILDGGRTFTVNILNKLMVRPSI